MARSTGVLLTQLVKDFGLSVAYQATDYDAVRLTVEDVSRPGLPMAGFFDHFEPMRLQVLGKVEDTFLKKMAAADREAAFDRFFSYKIPALLIARDLEPLPECLEMAKKHDVTVLRSADSTSNIVSSIISGLKVSLAPSRQIHGVLVEVYGEGLLLTGESGLGKSECAVELLKRGHRLISDDVVELKRISPTTIMGRAPDLVANYVEMRGIGIVDVKMLFGIGAVREENAVNLVINIVPWSNKQVYDRLGLDNQYTDILGVQVPFITLPITAGRNLAVLMEVAAMNNRQKRMGHNAARTFSDNIDNHFNQAKD